jgi:CO dehydrogenase/acetyl-CoA synthase delta subunit
LGKVGAVAAALMAIKAPGLVMTLVAIIAGLAGKHAMFSDKVGVMIWRNPFTFVTGIALLDCHRSVILMRHLLCIRLLREIHQDASQKRKHENNLFH